MATKIDYFKNLLQNLGKYFLNHYQRRLVISLLNGGYNITKIVLTAYKYWLEIIYSKTKLIEVREKTYMNPKVITAVVTWCLKK